MFLSDLANDLIRVFLVICVVLIIMQNITMIHNNNKRNRLINEIFKSLRDSKEQDKRITNIENKLKNL